MNLQWPQLLNKVSWVSDIGKIFLSGGEPREEWEGLKIRLISLLPHSSRVADSLLKNIFPFIAHPRNRQLCIVQNPTYLEFVLAVLSGFFNVMAKHLSPGGHWVVVTWSCRHLLPRHLKHLGPAVITFSCRNVSCLRTQHMRPGHRRPPEEELVTRLTRLPRPKQTCSQEYCLLSLAPFSSTTVSFIVETHTSCPWNFTLRLLSKKCIFPSFGIVYCTVDSRSGRSRWKFTEILTKRLTRRITEVTLPVDPSRGWHGMTWQFTVWRENQRNPPRMRRFKTIAWYPKL